MRVKKAGKSKFGHYLMDEDSKFTSTTEAVSNFLEKQLPCEIEITDTEGEGKQLKVTRVQVLGQQTQSTQQDNSMNQFETPITQEKPGLAPAENYKPSPNFYETQDRRQESIVNQFSIREGIKLIEVFNALSEEKLKPTMNQIYANAKIIKEVYDKLMNRKEELPDY